jgi:uncharacterized linocin/CFP29 family protein
MTSFGRQNMSWDQALWDRIDCAVHEELRRSRVAEKFLPLYGPLPASVLTVPAHAIDPSNPQLLSVAEDAVIPLVELWVEFSLTTPQVHSEAEVSSATFLATRAANFLSQAQDLIIFQGLGAAKTASPLFSDGTVQLRGNPVATGLLERVPADNVIQVERLGGGTGGTPISYGVNTSSAVSRAYSLLNAKGFPGPCALTLHADVYADTYVPLDNTLIMPADRITPLVTAGYYGTGTLPFSTGIMVSVGGNTMDLAVGLDATVSFQQVDTQGLHRFRLTERFALRIKDPTALVRLEFE